MLAFSRFFKDFTSSEQRSRVLSLNALSYVRPYFGFTPSKLHDSVTNISARNHPTFANTQYSISLLLRKVQAVG